MWRLLAVCLAVASFASAELCQFQKGQIYTRDEVMACFVSIPLAENIKIQTLDTLNKTKELYVFNDIAHDSPDPNLPLQVDLGGSLKEILTTNYQSAFEFHEALRALYTGLNDAHTQYYRPTCFQNFLVRQPISPASYIENGVNKIFVSRHMASDLYNYFPETNFSQLIGNEILSIDGISAYDYFQDYADHHVGMSKDSSTRFHITMVQPQPQPSFEIFSPSYWSERTKRNPFPERDSVTYNIANVGEMSFEWTFEALKTYNGVEDFQADYYNSYSPSASHPPKKNSMEKGVGITPRVIRTAASDLKTTPPGYQLILNTDVIYFWALNDTKTLVMYINTMVPDDRETYLLINKALTIAAEMGLSRMIIDLTNNGGGSICFGRALLSYFQHQAEGTINWGPEDLPLSPLQANFTNSAVEQNLKNTVWSPGFYRDQDGNAVANSDVSVIMPGVPHERGGHLRNYSNLVHINQCGFWGNLLDPAVEFKPDDILILTHGFCGSTCALFANHAALYDNIRTVVAGGRADRDQQQYTSFPGGQVLEDGDVWFDMEEFGYDTAPHLPVKGDILPARLPTTATFRFCCREIYPPAIVNNPDANPMEFTYQPATYKIDDTMESAEDPYTLWYSILPLFDQ